jgi:hypothetical protein
VIEVHLDFVNATLNVSAQHHGPRDIVMPAARSDQLHEAFRARVDKSPVKKRQTDFADVTRRHKIGNSLPEPGLSHVNDDPAYAVTVPLPAARIGAGSRILRGFVKPVQNPIYAGVIQADSPDNAWEGPGSSHALISSHPVQYH